MSDLFKLQKLCEGQEAREKTIQIGLDIKVAGRERFFPVSEPCRSYQDLESEIGRLREPLEHLLEQGRDFFDVGATGLEDDFATDMKPAEIWTVLSETGDEAVFVARFNRLDEPRRRKVAEHVLTMCNVFSGKGAVFSARYDIETGTLA